MLLVVEKILAMEVVSVVATKVLDKKLFGGDIQENG